MQNDKTYASLVVERNEHVESCYDSISESCVTVSFHCNGPGFVFEAVKDELDEKSNR